MKFTWLFLLKYDIKFWEKSVIPEVKQRVIGVHLNGFISSEIALKYVSRSNESQTIQKIKETGSIEDKNRSGCSSAISITDENVTCKRKRLHRQLNVALVKHISRQIVNKRFIERKLCCKVAARKQVKRTKFRREI